ncbi:MAG: hypothetical protein RL685_1581 [Pseudomonadota bacterium]
MRSGFGAAALGCLGLALAACAASELPRRSAAPSRAPERVWAYRVQASAGARELKVSATLPPGAPAQLRLDRFADPFLRDLELRTAAGWRPVSSQRSSEGLSWHVPECEAHGCELRYRYLLGEAARQLDRYEYAAWRGGVLLAPPSTWLLHSREYAGSDRYRLSVDAPGLQFASGVWSSRQSEGSLEANADVLFQAPYSGFGRFRQQRVQVPGGVIDLWVGLDGGELKLSPDELAAAVSDGAGLLRDYFGRFPVPELALIVVPVEGDDWFGMQLGNGGASILLFLGRSATKIDPRHDWVLVHEMFHLGLPTLVRRHLWLAEGLATYQEPLARARAGFISERALWREFLIGMPKGLPRAADGGLDGARSWGRTYWGGALFFLLADLQIRSASGQRHSLDDAIRGILAAGGDTSVRWTALQTLAAGDRAIGGRVLEELYGQHAARAIAIDLAALFRRLGVGWREDEVVFDDGAEWAPLRRALTAPSPALTIAAVSQGQSGLASPGVPKSPL